MDKAGKKYWNSVWSDRGLIQKINTNYYTYQLLHQVFNKYLHKDSTKTICEIGCAMSPYLLYFHDHFDFQINGFDYDCDALKKTEVIYKHMDYQCKLYCHNFFEEPRKRYDILFSWGVFEHFENLEDSIAHTVKYLVKDGFIVTLIPNMNGIVGFLQKFFNKRVYDIHIPYTKNDLLKAHEEAGYRTLFCDYIGIYQAGVININGVKNEEMIRKLLAIPGKPLFYLHKFTKLKFDSSFNSPYILYIGKKK